MKYKVTGTVGEYDVNLEVSPVETEPTPDPPTQEPDIIAWKGETIYIREPDMPVEVEPYEYELFELVGVETINPSWEGARVGTYFDALMPTDSFSRASLARVKIPRDATPGTYTIMGKVVRIEDMLLPEKPAMPMYMELASQKCLDARFQATNTQDWSEQVWITKEYIQLLRDYWIEPTKHTVTYYPSNLEQYSWRELAFDGAIAPPLIWAGTPGGSLNESWIRSVAAVAPLGSMFYGIDEAGTGPSGVSVEQALARMLELKEAAPGMKVMQTGVWHPEYEDYNRHEISFNSVSVYTDQYLSEGIPVQGEYGSCMATGNCVNTSQPNPRRTPHYPVHVLEGGYEDDWKASIIRAYEKGLDYYMHFSANLRLTTCWEPGGLYNEGGNGDGTQIYYHPETGLPLPSMRLVAYHEALQEVTKRAQVA